MVTKIDPLKIKEKMIEVYGSYIDNPEDKENRKNIHSLWDRYDMSTGYSFYDSATSKAVGYLAFLLQSGKHEYFTKERVLIDAKKILEDLHKS